MKTAREGRPRRLHRLDWRSFLNHLLLPRVRLRLIVLKRGKRRVYLLTNVLESTRLSRPWPLSSTGRDGA